MPVLKLFLFYQQIVLLLHNVLFKMEEYGECVQLADLIVSEQYQLYKVSAFLVYDLLCLSYCFWYVLSPLCRFSPSVTLYLQIYSQGQLGELMVKIADASLALLEQKKDPWGQPLSS